VGHPVHPLPDVGRADAVCSQYHKPEGVTFRFQVCSYSIEPAGMEVETLACSKSFCESVCSGDLAFLNRDKESSLKLRTDNF
jgi:hypothetical protein